MSQRRAFVVLTDYASHVTDPPVLLPNRGHRFSKVSLRDVNLRDVDLRDANLSRANLNGVNLTGVDLSGANLSNADLRGANLWGADLNKVTWSNTTCPDGTDSNDDGGACIRHL
jgi:uncharacterized protein YjbI with pentapeptide repeats